MEECQPPPAPSQQPPGAQKPVFPAEMRRAPAPARMPRPSHISQLAQQGVAWWEVSCLLWEQFNVTAPEAPMEGSLPCGGAAGTEKAPGLGLRPVGAVAAPRGMALMPHLGQMSLSVWCVLHSQPHSSIRQSLSAGRSGAGDRWPCPCAGSPLPPARPAPGSLHATSMGPVAEAESVRHEGRGKI